jgi:hypothetical protein
VRCVTLAGILLLKAFSMLFLGDIWRSWRAAAAS